MSLSFWGWFRIPKLSFSSLGNSFLAEKTSHILIGMSLRLVFLVVMLFSGAAVSERTIFPLPTNVMGRVDLRLDASGNTVNKVDVQTRFGNRIGSVIAVEVDLINLSSTPQTGTIVMLPVSTHAAGWCSYPSGDYLLSASLVVCGPSGGAHVDVANTFSTNIVPSSVTWSMAGFGSTKLSVSLWLEGKAGNSQASGCDSGYTFRFSPRMKIIVNEHRGAVLSSYATVINGMSTSDKTTTCSGKTFLGAHFDGLLPAGSAAPVPVNGGRPF